jgi:hypothetical protein
VGTMTSDPSPLPKLEASSFPAEDPGDLCPDPLEKVASLSPSAKGLQCPAPRAPAFPTAATTSGTNETWSRAAAQKAGPEPFRPLFRSPGCTSAVPFPIPHSPNRRYLAEFALSCSLGNADSETRVRDCKLLVLAVLAQDPEHRGENGGYFPYAGDPETRPIEFFTPNPTSDSIYPPERIITPICHHSDQWIGADLLPRLS